MRAAAMLASKYFLTALLFSAAAAQALTPAPQAVYIDVCVAEQEVDRVVKGVNDPVMKLLKTLPGTGAITSAMTHGKAQFQVGFKGGATEDDRTTVEAALKRTVLDDVIVLSVTVELGHPRDDGLFMGRRACRDHVFPAGR